jgi:hypothetical protein
MKFQKKFVAALPQTGYDSPTFYFIGGNKLFITNPEEAKHFNSHREAYKYFTEWAEGRDYKENFVFTIMDIYVLKPESK